MFLVRISTLALGLVVANIARELFRKYLNDRQRGESGRALDLIVAFMSVTTGLWLILSSLSTETVGN